MLLVIGSKSYQAPKEIITRCLKAGKYASQNKNCIYALQFANVIEMRREEFDSTLTLFQQIYNYQKKGIKVHYNKK